MDLTMTVFAGTLRGIVAEGKVEALGLVSRKTSPQFPNIPAPAVPPRLQGRAGAAA